MRKNLLHFEEIVYNIGQVSKGRRVRICAVGKTQSAEAVQEALDAGIEDIAENRVQEAAEKFPLLKGGRRHLIGPLQSNKENKALELFDVIQTLESLDQCRRLCAKLERLKIKKSFYIQVNTSGEEQKHGVHSEAEVCGMASALLSCPYAHWEGLMTIGPLEGSPRPSFAALYQLRLRLEKKFALPLELSMGMSGDYTEAVQEGSTLVRLGTALFGKRNYL